MKKYTIELSNDLSAIYEDIAKMNHKSVEESLQIILKKLIDTLSGKNTPDKPERTVDNKYFPWFDSHYKK